jgi:hypothetical protein
MSRLDGFCNLDGLVCTRDDRRVAFPPGGSLLRTYQEGREIPPGLLVLLMSLSYGQANVLVKATIELVCGWIGVDGPGNGACTLPVR